MRLVTHLLVRNNIDRLFLRSCKNCGCNWCWICREKGATHSKCPKPLKEVAQTNLRERFKLASAAVARLETADEAHSLTEPCIMHRVRARLLQAYFTSVASEMYIPDLIALPPISLRRRVFSSLVQTLPNVATVFQDAQALLELVPFASLADALQLPSQEAAKRLKAILQHLRREVQSVPSSQLLISITSTMIDFSEVVEMPDDATAADLKQYIYEKYGIPVEELRIITTQAAKLLKNDDLLSSDPRFRKLKVTLNNWGGGGGCWLLKNSLRGFGLLESESLCINRTSFATWPRGLGLKTELTHSAQRQTLRCQARCKEAGRKRQRDRLERGECASSSQKHSKRAGDAERRNKNNNKGLQKRH